MERPDDDPELTRDLETPEDGETHATTAGAAAAGAVTGGVIGLPGGPLGAAIGAVGGALVGVAAERLMHGEDDDEGPFVDGTPVDGGAVDSAEVEGIAATPTDVTAATSAAALANSKRFVEREDESGR